MHTFQMTLTTQDDMTTAPSTLPPLPQAKVGRITRLPRGRGEFEDYAQAVLNGWEARKAQPASRRAESANAWFKREAYRFLCRYIDLGLVRVFEQVASHDRRPSKLVRDALKNPFKLGLLAMFSDDSPLSRNDRHVFGNQMLYAWAHDVPPDFLNAFLAVSGGPAVIARKLKAQEAEPGFEHRFKPERLLTEDRD